MNYYIEVTKRSVDIIKISIWVSKCFTEYGFQQKLGFNKKVPSQEMVLSLNLVSQKKLTFSSVSGGKELQLVPAQKSCNNKLLNTGQQILKFML